MRCSATDEYPGGVRGFVQKWASVATGLGITARKSRVKPETLRYPFEKLTMSPRWRGALRLTGVLGAEGVPPITAPSAEYNGAHRRPLHPW